MFSVSYMFSRFYHWVKSIYSMADGTRYDSTGERSLSPPELSNGPASTTDSTGAKKNEVPVDQKKVWAELQSEGRAKLLNVVDTLRQLGIENAGVRLPQIVVVGNQSSGKSSVLEAISQVPFPKNDVRCTRFPIELKMRRAQTRSSKVSILPHPTTTESSACERLRAWEKTDLTFEKVPQHIAEATEMMRTEDKNAIFFHHVLKLEMEEPSFIDLTLIDLPGLIHVNESSKSSGDMTRIEQMITSYIDNPRAIILAVISADYDVALHGTLALVKKHDPEGKRSVGIITKPDQTVRASNRQAIYLNLARNMHDSFKFDIGWHVLRNSAVDEPHRSSAQRDDVERAFFSTTPGWSTLGKSQVGVSTLRTKLSGVLTEHIKRNLRNVIDSIEEELAKCQTVLKGLGEARDSEDEKRGFLLDLATRTTHLTKEGLDGRYGDPYFSSRSRKLRAAINDTTDQFEKEIYQFGHRWQIDDSDNPSTTGLYSAPINTPSRSPSPIRTSGLPAPIEIKRAQYLDRVMVSLDENSGRELQGHYDPLLIGRLFYDQARRWEEISHRYATCVLKAVEASLADIVIEVFGAIRGNLMLQHVIEPEILKRKDALSQKLEELLFPYQSGGLHAITRNPRYYAKLVKARNNSETPRDIRGFGGKMSKLQACSDLVDGMQCYYEVARTTFADNVIILGVERCLLNGLEQVLTPSSVYKMKSNTLEILASESLNDMESRAANKARLTVLLDAQQTCKHYAYRQFIQRPKASISSPEPNHHILPTREPHQIDLTKKPETAKIRNPSSTSGVAAVATPQVEISSASSVSGPRKTDTQRSPSPRPSQHTLGSASVSPAGQSARAASPAPTFFIQYLALGAFSHELQDAGSLSEGVCSSSIKTRRRRVRWV